MIKCFNKAIAAGQSSEAARPTAEQSPQVFGPAGLAFGQPRERAQGSCKEGRIDKAGNGIRRAPGIDCLPGVKINTKVILRWDGDQE